MDILILSATHSMWVWLKPIISRAVTDGRVWYSMSVPLTSGLFRGFVLTQVCLTVRM